MSARRTVVLFAKWPAAGRAKRRLATGIGRDAARRLARSFLVDTVRLAESAGDELVIAFAPPASRERFALLAPRARLVPQPRGAFGTRLAHAVESGLARGGLALVIGADSPTLPASHLRRAFTRLAHADASLGPTRDGGYYLIAARRSLPRSLFTRMPWSTMSVRAESVRRARDAGLRVALLPSWYDVDDANGLRRLARDRRGLGRARATRETLGALGLL